MSGTVTANVGGSSGLVQAPAGVPSGVILMWHGDIADIPTGWVLCNGSNSTPDLRGRFIQGAAVDKEANDPVAGGSATAAPGNHSAHSVTQPADHTVTQPADHTVTQPADHSVTQPNGHSTHSALSSHQHTLPVGRNVGAGTPVAVNQIYGNGGNSTLGGYPNYHTQLSGVGAGGTYNLLLDQATAAGTPNAHSAHSGSAVNSHGSTAVSAHGSTAVNAHGSTAVDAHSAHSTSDSRPPFYTILYIMKS